MPRKYKKKKYTVKRSRKKSYYTPIPFMIGAPSYTGIFHNDATLAIVNNSTSPALGVLVFQLDQCLGYTKYQAIMDYYRINWVKVTFEPCRTQSLTTQTDQTTAPSSITQVPKLITAIDRDSNTTALSYAAIQARGSVKETLATKTQVWKFTPNRLVTVYKSVATNGFKIDTSNDYLDCANADVPHFGMKYAMEASQPVTGFKSWIRVEYCVSFKGKRA